jgi:hypothetical protein
LSNSEWQVEVEVDGRVYKDNVSYPGLVLAVKEARDKKSKQYKVQAAMLEAINKKIKPQEDNNAS